MTKQDILEVDVASASVKTTCDSCGKVIGAGWPNAIGSFGITLSDGKDADGYDKNHTYHACGEECLRNLLNKRAEAASKKS